MGRYKFDGQTSWGWCRVVDISLIGAGLELRGEVPKNCTGRRVVVNVESGMRLVGECRHASRDNSGRTRIGIEFSVVGASEQEPHILVGTNPVNINP
jgi:hypothetical protein